MVDTFFSDSVENTAGRKWSCVKPDEGEEETVLEMIEAGSCNFATDLDAHDLYDANKLHGFQAVAAEDYTGEGKGLTYYGVAVVPASACAANPEITLGDLKGLRSCHTGYKRTSGWTIPLANVVDLGSRPRVRSTSRTRTTTTSCRRSSRGCAPPAAQRKPRRCSAPTVTATASGTRTPTPGTPGR